MREDLRPSVRPSRVPLYKDGHGEKTLFSVSDPSATTALRESGVGLSERDGGRGGGNPRIV